MTLQRRLILAITCLIFFLLAANLVVTVHNARLSLFQQLQVHAQDTATSLGFSVSQVSQAGDDVQVSSMIDAIYDRGYYRQIIYRDLEGNDKVRRESALVVPQVPLWFTELLPLPEPSGVAQIASGWYQLGELEVVSHPGFAYQDLWRSFKEQLWLFFLTAVICYGLSGIALRYILRPLHQVEEQAAAICRRQFPVQDTLPNIPELRRVVIAMNQMVQKVQDMFLHQITLNDRLHEQLRTDPVTGLANRQDFDQRLSAYLASERSATSGALLLAQVGNLHAINLAQGRHNGDDYLCCIADTLNKLLKSYPHYLCSRHAGADFAIFVPAVDEEESKALMLEIYSMFQELEWEGEKIQPVAIGVVYVSKIAASTNLMALADTALSKAQNEQESGYYWQNIDSAEPSLSASDWSNLLSAAIQEQSLNFQYQPVWRIENGCRTLLFNEIMTRIHVDDKDYSAGAFMPMATRFKMIADIDALVLETIVEEQSTMPDYLCVNLSISSVDNELFRKMLKQKLINNPQLASRLVFELPANGLSFAEDTIREFAAMIKACGSYFSLHHFGRGTAEFAYLQTLPVDYLKIDRCFIQHVAEDGDAKFFIRSLIAIAKSCDVTILAEGVETEEQWQALVSLGIQGGQGYWLGRPSSDPVSH